MDFAACEKCGRLLHESFWIDRGDALYCPACGMPATKLYGIPVALTSTPRKPSTSVEEEQAARRRLA